MICVVGGNGFIGSGFVRMFARLGMACINITRENYQEHAGAACDILINANGNSSKLLSKSDPMADFDANVRSVRKLMEDFSPESYIHISSCDVYADCSSPLTTREDILPDPRTLSGYGFHKLLGEQCVRHTRKKWLILRPGGFVGPGLKKNAVFDILNGEKLWLDPASRLQFMHTDVFAEVVWNLHADGVSNEILNICGAGTMELLEIMELAGKRIPAAPNAPKVLYEVSLDKVSSYCRAMPSTRSSIERFILEQRRTA